MNDGYVLQVVAYIQQCQARGMNEAAIRNALIASGWPILLIDEGFRRVYAGGLASPARSYAGQQNVPAESPYAASVPRQPQPMFANTSKSPLPDVRRKRRTIIGVLWILSPGLLFLMGFVVALILNALNVQASLFDAFNLVATIVMPILLFVGPIIGIAILVKSSR